MAHAQQQILDAVAAVLAGGSTAAGTRVFLDRVDPLQPNELPAITVDEAGEGESVEQTTIHSVEQRALGVTVACIVAHGSQAAAQARELGLQVEKLLAGSTALLALCKLGVQINSSRIVISGEGDRLMASREQNWTMTYMVAAETPDIIF
ncbi:MAG: hypothetical protein Q8S12_00365 [Hydrogenophaga sp.]|uniref:hypothetical protein n=1 Tax=Hydrogenophaga sp. TaxID=1904254 RepID=UPI00273283D1|nr:hypothetical protein [Hydrogenophaga sp.]MDP3625019.1 hypothetical protein [Hydrogenophaga sp.]